VAALACAPVGRAQDPGNCELGQAQGVIDVGEVYAEVFNTGSLFFGNQSQAAYRVPRHEWRSPIFTAGLWVGGLAGGELRVVGATYSDFEFWPGPLDPATGRPPNPDDCSAFDRIWRVGRHDVAEYYRTGLATRDLAEWPHHLGAPVLDGDGDPTNYSLAGGDQPAISGDQMLWWVMNDVGNDHENSLVPPIGLEVQVSVFGFGGGPAALRQATFYRYVVINRSAVTLDSSYVLLFGDPDLGDASDDYVGTDTSRQMVFTYNADDADGNGSGGTYGLAPPAFGFQVVKGIAGLPDGRDGDGNGQVDEPNEPLGLTGSIGLPNGIAPPQGHPRNGEEMYHWMRGRWTDGTPITEGSLGLNGGGPETPLMYSGDPVTGRYWSERCPRRPVCGPALTAGNRYMTAASGPFVLEQSVPAELLLAMPFGRGMDHYDSITQLRLAADVVRNAYDAGLLDAQRVPGFLSPALPSRIEIRRPAPNPFDDAATIGITLPAAAGVRVALLDVLGREVLTAQDGSLEAGAHDVMIDAAGLAPGVYLARVWVAGQEAGALPVTRR
jgi:hypothetical protein